MLFRSHAQARTAGNQKLTLTVAANYGGRWDVVQAINRMVRERPMPGGQYSEGDLAPHLAMADAPEPDLFIRTGGEQRISNFVLWQLAYTELHISPLLWPDFGIAEFYGALLDYQQRDRRFGRVHA